MIHTQSKSLGFLIIIPKNEYQDDIQQLSNTFLRILLKPRQLGDGIKPILKYPDSPRFDYISTTGHNACYEGSISSVCGFPPIPKQIFEDGLNITFSGSELTIQHENPVYKPVQISQQVAPLLSNFDVHNPNLVLYRTNNPQLWNPSHVSGQWKTPGLYGHRKESLDFSARHKVKPPSNYRHKAQEGPNTYKNIQKLQTEILQLIDF